MFVSVVQLTPIFDADPSIHFATDLPLTSLETSWNPDIKDTDIDRCNEYGSNNHDLARKGSVRDDDTDSIDDDL